MVTSALLSMGPSGSELGASLEWDKLSKFCMGMATIMTFCCDSDALTSYCRMPDTDEMPCRDTALPICSMSSKSQIAVAPYAGSNFVHVTAR